MQQAINQLLGFKVLQLNTLLLGFARWQSNFQHQKFTVQQLPTQWLGFMVCWLNTHLWCCRQITSCSTGSAAVLPIITILTFTTPEKKTLIFLIEWQKQIKFKKFALQTKSRLGGQVCNVSYPTENSTYPKAGNFSLTAIKLTFN